MGKGLGVVIAVQTETVNCSICENVDVKMLMK